MERKSVISSNIASVGYDAATKILEVEFRLGTVWEYYDVPPEVHDALVKAGSVGSFFAGRIRNAYRSRKVEREEHVCTPRTRPELVTRSERGEGSSWPFRVGS